MDTVRVSAHTVAITKTQCLDVSKNEEHLLCGESSEGLLSGKWERFTSQNIVQGREVFSRVSPRAVLYRGAVRMKGGNLSRV